jgi:aerobic-type carbon monoxide dehydrogenase small subunit (CoxS/CutS family)
MSQQEMQVNGKRYALPDSEGRRLVDWLRSDLGLTGTKEGCGTGDCGACNVLLDGRVASSCCMLVHCITDREITTIEGIAAQDPADPLLEAFVSCGAFQCGYCVPGMVIAARAFLNRVAQESPAPEPIRPLDVQTAISGNICRCTGYKQIIDAILTAASAQGLSCEPLEKYYVIGEEL